jgi:alpha-ketoglutaric semialdehyde dehydrogenase
MASFGIMSMDWGTIEGRSSALSPEGMTMLHEDYVGGGWVVASTGETFESPNPANGEVVGEVVRSSAADVDASVRAAEIAFDSWRLYPAPRRAEILFRVGEAMIRRNGRPSSSTTRVASSAPKST